jgi:uncharacterized membrane protein YjdF
MDNTQNSLLRTLSRLLLAGLILFELFNQFGILDFTLDFTWFGLAITSIIAWVVLESVSRSLKKSCGQPMNAFAFLFAVGVVYVDALGDILHFYSKFGWYDQTAHFLGGMAIAGLAFDLLWQSNKCRKIVLGNWGLSFFSVFTASFVLILYELEEYLEDVFTGSHRLGDGPDTANDLMMGVLGAFVIIVIVNIVLKTIKIQETT